MSEKNAIREQELDRLWDGLIVICPYIDEGDASVVAEWAHGRIAAAVAAEREALIQWAKERAEESRRIAENSEYPEDEDHAASMGVAFWEMIDVIRARGDAEAANE